MRFTSVISAPLKFDAFSLVSGYVGFQFGLCWVMVYVLPCYNELIDKK